MFANRSEAGKLLAERLAQELKNIDLKTLIILSIPRGGVIIGKSLSRKFGCPHDVIVTKKLRAPSQKELAIGAVGETKGSLYLDERLAHDVGADREYINKEIDNCRQEIGRREKIYRGGKKEIILEGKTVVIVDDGAATGATIIAASREVWNRNPHKLIIALPVCALDTLGKLEKEADAVVVLETPEIFYAVGQFYQDFPQIEDEEVVKLLS